MKNQPFPDEQSWQVALNVPIEAAWEQVYRLCFHPVTKKLNGMGCSPETAHDIFQESLIALSIALAIRRIIQTVYGFLLGTARHKWFDEIKKRLKMQELETTLTRESAGDPATMFEFFNVEQEQVYLLKKHCENLSEKDQGILIAAYCDNLSYKEIAEKFNIGGKDPAGNARQQVFQALKRLRISWESDQNTSYFLN